jgi:hypothetical protein
MACGAVASWNPPGTVGNPHAPPPTSKCYTPEGASGAGSSNLGWGNSHPADAIDQYMQDQGNEELGHRRWIVNPSLGQVGIGYYAGGGPYRSAQCLGIFDGSGRGPRPAWLAFPPPGFVPVEIARWTWSFHGGQSGAAQMTVRRKSDNAALAMTRLSLSDGYGALSTTSFTPSGWVANAGETYFVSVTGATAAPISYEVKPVTCN